MQTNDSTKQSTRCIFLLAGEASGDLYGGMLVEALRKEDPNLTVIAWGGEHMERAGARVLRHYKTMAFMGFLEVIKNLGTIRALFQECEQILHLHKPMAFVGIDYPGFNLKMAKKAQLLGMVTHHYISPSLWAWNKKRVHTIRQHIDQLHVILPFEKKWFAEHDVDVNFVGHPLLELQESSAESSAESMRKSDVKKAVLALVPGSRKQEVERMLPVFLEVARQLPNFTPIVAGAPGLDPDHYQMATDEGVEIRFESTRTLMQEADVGLVTSGTATLEAALLGLPQIICYKTSGVTYRIAKILARSKWIGLPNILFQESIVPERIQQECTPEQLILDIQLIHNSKGLLPDGLAQLKRVETLKRQLQGPGIPSELVARAILNQSPLSA
jgi:lipid-A-disaccharide synthase